MVRAPRKNGNEDDNGENTDNDVDDKLNKRQRQIIKQANQDNESNGKGEGNSKENDNDKDGKKNLDRGTKKNARQAKKNQESGKGQGNDNNKEGNKGDKKAARKERRRQLAKSHVKQKVNKNDNYERKGKYGKGNDERKPNGEGKIHNGNEGRRQRKVKKAEKKQDKDGGKEEQENVNSSNLGKRKNKIKARKEKKNPAETVKQTTCPVSDLCVTTAVNYLRIVQNQVANFKNQKARIERQNTTGFRKNEKKDVFAAANNRLVEFAGGNKTAPTCGTLTTGAGVNNIKNLTDTLNKCSDNIKAACDIPALPQPNTTFVDGKLKYMLSHMIYNTEKNL